MNVLVNLNLLFTDVSYVENIFVFFFQSTEHLEIFINYINLKHRNAKFTFEAKDLNNLSVSPQMVSYLNFSQSHI